MNRAAILLATGIFWAIMMAALVKREIIPQLEYASMPTYRTMFKSRRTPELERWKIMLGAEHRGQAEVLYRPLNGRYRTCTWIEARFKMPKVDLLPDLGDQPLSLRSEVNVDAGFQLADFSMTAKVSGIAMSGRGSRRGDKLLFRYDLLGKPIEKEMDFPPDATLADGFVPYMGNGKLWVGKKWAIQSVDISAGLKPVKQFARVVREEKVRWNDQDLPTSVVEILKSEQSELPLHTLWVDSKGTVLIDQMNWFGDGLLYTLVLEEKRALSPEETRDWELKKR